MLTNLTRLMTHKGNIHVLFVKCCRRKAFSKCQLTAEWKAKNACKLASQAYCRCAAATNIHNTGTQAKPQALGRLWCLTCRLETIALLLGMQVQFQLLACGLISRRATRQKQSSTLLYGNIPKLESGLLLSCWRPNMDSLPAETVDRTWPT